MREGGTIGRADVICLACGEPLPEALARCASLRCADCRDERAPIRADLLARLRRPIRLRRAA
ncbi:MAG: hypothetical protein ACYDA3_14510 [Gaiellaceae bacterium]